MPGTRTQICLFLSDSSKVALSSDSVFGHMLHEWTCTDVRLWFDYEDRAEPKPYRIVEQTEGEWLIEIAGEPEERVHLTFEGECYKVLQPTRNFFEYFCPVQPQPGGDAPARPATKPDAA